MGQVLQISNIKRWLYWNTNVCIMPQQKVFKNLAQEGGVQLVTGKDIGPSFASWAKETKVGPWYHNFMNTE